MFWHCLERHKVSYCEGEELNSSAHQVFIPVIGWSVNGWLFMENFTCVYSSTPVPSNSFANTNVGLFFLFIIKELIVNLTQLKHKLDGVSRRLSSSTPKDENLRQQVSDLDSLMKGVIKLVLSKQQHLRSAVEKMVKVETSLLNRRDFEAKLQEWSQLLGEMENFVEHFGPFNEDDKDLEFLYFEVTKCKVKLGQLFCCNDYLNVTVSSALNSRSK